MGCADDGRMRRGPARAQGLNVVDNKGKLVGVYEDGSHGEVAVRNVAGQRLALPVSPAGFVSLYDNDPVNPLCCVLYTTSDRSGTAYFWADPTEAGQMTTFPFALFPTGGVYFLKVPAQQIGIGSCAMFTEVPRFPTLVGTCLAPNHINDQNAACAAFAPESPAAPMAAPLDLSKLKFAPPFHLAK